MKRIWIVLIIMFYCQVTRSQQMAQFTQTILVPVAINPAVAGATEGISFNGIARQQWAGARTEKGTSVSPRTFYFGIDAPVRFLHGGTGLSVVQDQLGFDNSMSVNLTYAYHLNLGPGNLKIGIQTIFLNRKRDFSKFDVLDENDPVFNNKSVQSVILTDFAAGIHYTIPEKFRIGISSFYLSEAKGSIEGSATLQTKRHYYFTTDSQFELNASGWNVQPSLLIESDEAATQFNLNCLMTNEKYWAGLGYRMQDAVLFLLGIDYHGLKIGYAYDWTTSKIKKNGSMGSHELFLNYKIKIRTIPPKTIYKNARYI